jgi:DNA/RNA-binding domain of Phe-tRNA-synthetase-like protein
MKLVVAHEIAERYPDLRVGIVVATEIDNIGCDSSLEEIRQSAIQSIRQRFTLESLASHPHIRTWQDVYHSFGANPKRTPPTVEGLARRILKGKEVASISKIVDLYLLAEFSLLIPVGGYDLNCLEGDLHLRLSPGAEQFTPIGENDTNTLELTKPGEILYADSARVLTRLWNYRDCDFAKITEQSTKIALFAEAPSQEISDNDLASQVQMMANLIRQFCGGKVVTQIAAVRQNTEFLF